MDFASTRKISLPRCLMLATLVFALSGCATGPIEPKWKPVPCPADCKVPITLRKFDSKLPEIPADRMKVIVDGGSRINFEIKGGRDRADARTELKAAAPIFVGENRALVDKIELSQGSNNVVIAGFENCDKKFHKDMNGVVMCEVKYDVINVGNKNRKPLDPWIIIRR